MFLWTAYVPSFCGSQLSDFHDVLPVVCKSIVGDERGYGMKRVKPVASSPKELQCCCRVVDEF